MFGLLNPDDYEKGTLSWQDVVGRPVLLRWGFVDSLHQRIGERSSRLVKDLPVFSSLSSDEAWKRPGSVQSLRAVGALSGLCEAVGRCDPRPTRRNADDLARCRWLPHQMGGEGCDE